MLLVKVTCGSCCCSILLSSEAFLATQYTDSIGHKFKLSKLNCRYMELRIRNEGAEKNTVHQHCDDTFSNSLFLSEYVLKRELTDMLW